MRASLIKEDDFVYLDAGTTTELMIDYLTTKQTVFVTMRWRMQESFPRQDIRRLFLAAS